MLGLKLNHVSKRGPKRTGIWFCLVGDSDIALPVSYKVTWSGALGYRFLNKCQKPTPQHWFKVSTSICWLDPHTLSSCSPEGVCQRTPELASPPLASCAFHRWKLVHLKWIRRTHKGLEKHRGTLSGMQHHPAWWGCISLEERTDCMCLTRVIWQMQGTEMRSLDLLLGPTLVQSVLGFSWYTTMPNLMWQECASDI